MSQVKFLKDCKWCICNEFFSFLKDEIRTIEDSIAEEMVKAKYAIYSKDEDKQKEKEVVVEKEEKKNSEEEKKEKEKVSVENKAIINEDYDKRKD